MKVLVALNIIYLSGYIQGIFLHSMGYWNLLLSVPIGLYIGYLAGVYNDNH